MRRFKKKFVTPKKLWSKARLLEEKEIKKEYGLKNMHEIWKADYLIKKIRKIAKGLIKASPEQQQAFIARLAARGFLPFNATIDDALTLDRRAILNRRLQTIVYKRGLANTIKHARQLIAHGHIYLGEKRITVPSYLVKLDEEDKITCRLKAESAKSSESESPESLVGLEESSGPSGGLRGLESGESQGREGGEGKIVIEKEIIEKENEINQISKIS
ncbi:MAG: 30S ribosomal protein S4 [Candidatus Pacearchaeota archaeon]